MCFTVNYCTIMQMIINLTCHWGSAWMKNGFYRSWHGVCASGLGRWLCMARPMPATSESKEAKATDTQGGAQRTWHFIFQPRWHKDLRQDSAAPK